eukprot:TRINITY_DN29202_c0_g1_i1.p1 TRINITY_DN29202_c0_g1~~TRINITY_DN29202_c0_g1_i1.p1  ORF type:complete len:300 (-),score=97.12 TRINITY_DN29202_c0_g1_i1:75-974(-)
MAATAASEAITAAPKLRSVGGGMSLGARRCLRLVLGLTAMSFGLQGWLPPTPFESAPRGFVVVPSMVDRNGASSNSHRLQRLQRHAASQDEAGLAQENERLKAELAALRGQQAPAPQPPAAAAPEPAVQAPADDSDDKFKLRSSIMVVLEEMQTEIKGIEDARLGFTEDGNFLYAEDPKKGNNVIFKRKSEVLQASLTQQENYQSSISAATKKGKQLESMKKLCELEAEFKKNSEYKELKQMYMEGNQWVDIVYKDVVPSVALDPVKDTLLGLLATGALVFATLLVCLCLFPPFIPPDN